jgi:hypothetical protein
MKPHRIRLSRKKGWRMPPNTVKVDRTTRWGNPYKVDGSRIQTPQEAANAFEYFMGCGVGRPVELKRRLHELRGKNLACWCPIGSPCHADVLLRIANE